METLRRPEELDPQTPGVGGGGWEQGLVGQSLDWEDDHVLGTDREEDHTTV